MVSGSLSAARYHASCGNLCKAADDGLLERDAMGVGDREYPHRTRRRRLHPPGTYHQFINTSHEPVKLHFLYVLGGEAQAIQDAEFR